MSSLYFNMACFCCSPERANKKRGKRPQVGHPLRGQRKRQCPLDDHKLGTHWVAKERDSAPWIFVGDPLIFSVGDVHITRHQYDVSILRSQSEPAMWHVTTMQASYVYCTHWVPEIQGLNWEGGLVSKAKREIHNCWILVRATLNIKRRVHSHASVV